MKVDLSKIIILTNFVKDISQLEGNVIAKSLKNSQNIVDAKSIMGVLTLNISEPIWVEYKGKDEIGKEKFKNIVSKYAAL